MTLREFIDMLNIGVVIGIETRSIDQGSIELTYRKMPAIDDDNYLYGESEWLVRTLEKCPVVNIKNPNDGNVPIIVVVNIDQIDLEDAMIRRMNDLNFRLCDIQAEQRKEADSNEQTEH